jgi:osmoprotectant transport system permease protein
MEGYRSFIEQNAGNIALYTKNQFELLVVVMAIAVAVWVPTGVLISQKRKLAPKVLSLANVIYCIPSLSLFVIFVAVPGLGIGRRSATLALVLYAMMPLTRNVYQGIVGVDKTVIEAARGMGMSRGQILREVTLPLAMPVIFAGFRVTLVMTASLGTVAVYVGEKNLGRFIITGLSRSYVEMIVVGGGLICAITIALDLAMGFLETRVVPKGLRPERGRLGRHL